MQFFRIRLSDPLHLKACDNDHLGSVNVITDINGTRVQLVEYDPWGTLSRSEGTIDTTHRFTGQMLDPESGLYYYGGRYYDPEISRFISPDPFVPELFDPQSLNATATWSTTRKTTSIQGTQGVKSAHGSLGWSFRVRVFLSIQSWQRDAFRFLVGECR